MKWKFSGKVRGGYLTAFLLLLVAYFFTLTATLQLRKQNIWLNHTREVINKIELMISYLKDSEIGFRGLVMMKDQKYLLPYYTSQPKVDSIYRALDSTTVDNLLQQQRLHRLKELIDSKFVLLSQQIDSLQGSHLEMNNFVKVKAGESKNLMDSIRFYAGLMESREEGLLRERKQKVLVTNGIVYGIILVTLFISILSAVYSLITFNMENKAKRIAKMQADKYHRELEERIIQLDKANEELLEFRGVEKFTNTGRLARVIAHEVRNPLTNIDLSVSQLLSKEMSKEDKNVFLEIIERNSKRINGLIRDLLDATRFSELNLVKTDINVLLDEAIAQADDRIQFQNVTLQKKYAAGLPALFVDKDRMRIAFLNIIVNAIESMNPDEGILTIETNWKINACIILIADNGKGMDEETMSHIFDPYYSSKNGGNGLGLTNTQNIILNHKGRISVKSKPGQGTVFTILLNAEETASAETPAADA